MIHGLTDVPGIEQYIRSGTRNETMLGPTYDIKVPTFGATLWRYMDFTKLVSLLEHRAIFFARADKLGDPFEGAWSNVNLKFLENRGNPTVRSVASYREEWQSKNVGSPLLTAGTLATTSLRRCGGCIQVWDTG